MFPILVYKCPGEHHAHDGATYKYRSASSQEEFDKLYADDWHDSLVKAVESFKSPAKVEPEIVVEEDQSQADENMSPTREEMEVKAKELGIKFDGRTSDAKLLKLINASL